MFFQWMIFKELKKEVSDIDSNETLPWNNVEY